MEKEDQIHKKHRERLRKKVKENGLKSLAEHEVLEFLLTYVIPRKDTNPIAHNLIYKFGGFSKAIDANFNSLKNVKGMGEQSALFISALSQFIEIYKKYKSKEMPVFLSTFDQCVQYFRENFDIKNNEFLYLSCLSKNFKLLKTVQIEGFNDTDINVDARDLTSNFTDKNIYYIVLFHTHPGGNVTPSREDYLATKKIKLITDSLGIKMLDHLIFNETNHFSFKRETNIIEQEKM